MKRCRGIPAITVCAVVMFAGVVAIWLVTFFATSPASAYAHAPTCTRGTGTPAGCRATVTATVAAAGQIHIARSGIHGWVKLSGPGVPTAIQREAIGAWSSMGLNAGQHVQVALWSGQVVSVTSGGYTGYTPGYPPADRFSVVWMSLILLAATLALARFYRDPLLGGRRIRMPRVVDRAIVPAFVAVTLAFVVHRGLAAFLAVVVVGGVAGPCYLAAMPWNRGEPDRPAPVREPEFRPRTRPRRLRGLGPDVPPWA